MMKNTFFHIRDIVLCDHFGDIGFTDCVLGGRREKKKRTKKYGEKSHKITEKKADKVINVFIQWLGGNHHNDEVKCQMMQSNEVNDEKT